MSMHQCDNEPIPAARNIPQTESVLLEPKTPRHQTRTAATGCLNSIVPVSSTQKLFCRLLCLRNRLTRSELDEHAAAEPRMLSILRPYTLYNNGAGKSPTTA